MPSKICPRGHRFVKSGDCPVCPICEREHVPAAAFLALLSGPARRALEHEGITTVKKLATWSEADLLKLHGFGQASLPVLREVLQHAGLAFAEGNKRAGRKA